MAKNKSQAFMVLKIWLIYLSGEMQTLFIC